jgi:phosphate regulon transcriptional regulator PhoB
MKDRILVVEDDKNIAKLLKFNLEKAGYDCTVAPSGEKALEFFNSRPTDLVILDIMLPGIDGLEVCRAIRQKNSTHNVPIIMVTAKGTETDRIVGLELGADDYIVKPFSPRELILRIRAVLKRGKVAQPEKDVLSMGEIMLDKPKHKVMVKGKQITFTQMEFKLLSTLMERQGRLQTREKLLSDVWGIDSMVDTRTIDTHIKRLREKLGKAGDIIETVRGLGYKISDEYED